MDSHTAEVIRLRCMGGPMHGKMATVEALTSGERALIEGNDGDSHVYERQGDLLFAVGEWGGEWEAPSPDLAPRFKP